MQGAIMVKRHFPKFDEKKEYVGHKESVADKYGKGSKRKSICHGREKLGEKSKAQLKPVEHRPHNGQTFHADNVIPCTPTGDYEIDAQKNHKDNERIFELQKKQAAHDFIVQGGRKGLIGYCFDVVRDGRHDEDGSSFFNAALPLRRAVFTVLRGRERMAAIS